MCRLKWLGMVFTLAIYFHLVVSTKNLAGKKGKGKHKKNGEVYLKGNDPNVCRCGELRTKFAPIFQDIQAAAITPAKRTAEQNMSNVNITGYYPVSQMLGGSIHILPNRTTNTSRKFYREEDYEPYEVQLRPWLVVIRVSPEPLKNISDITECTGAILSRRWVITSKTCLCEDKFGCHLQPKIVGGKIVITIQPAKYYKYPNQTDVNLAYINRITVPLKNMSDPKNDMALLRLSVSLNFSDEVMPICLPQKKFHGTEGEVYISGFNFNFLRKHVLSEKCRTVSGPSKDKVCRDFQKNEVIYKICSLDSPPQARECVALKKFMKWDKMLPDGMRKIIILRNISQIDEQERKERFSRVKEDEVEIECFGENPGEFGWCGTCQETAKKGESGYCGGDMFGKNYKHNLARPSEFGGWGFCEKLCSEAAKRESDLRYNRETTLLEILRMVEPEELCKSHLKLHNTSFYHLCLSEHLSVQDKTVYRMFGKDRFELVPKTGIPTLIYPPSTSKIGDAGAPVFKVVNEKEYDDGSKTGHANAVLVGVMSANQFNPQIDANPTATAYTKLRKINEIITHINSRMMRFISNTLAMEDEEECFQ